MVSIAEPGVRDLYWPQGGVVDEGYQLKVDGVVQSLAGLRATAQVRSKPGATEILLDLDPYLSISADTVWLHVPATITPTLTRSAVWDLFLVPTTNPAGAVKLLKGAVDVDVRVTVDDGAPT